MTTVTSGFASASSNSNGNGNGGGTEFLSVLAPPGEALKDYDNTKSHTEQVGTYPQVFHDAMSVREEVYGEQGVPLEAEFDEDDSRSWHWVVYASVGSTSSPSPPSLHPTKPGNKEEEERRASATAQRLPVGTIRLVPPPHGPNKYKEEVPNRELHHPDSDPPAHIAAHPAEPYVKLGRLAILKPYRHLGLSKLLINAALVYAAHNPDKIRPPPSPTTMELANQLGKAVEKAVVWKGLIMVHAQAEVSRLWAKHGFAEELVNEDGEVEIAKEERWTEEGIEHLGMWKRLKLDTSRL
ncbi:acyl-CoA N-acyltransferase [Dendryphion nanum]|uniref:Acyl-CoA N-acyltransferase n=1 Tax=Dendryphion nanum TaxID=256645 RepID=A0A9P9E1M5_9PLEO|nr:acyl-CoA N-acyltransferase [Dendryphion nanum]